MDQQVIQNLISKKSNKLNIVIVGDLLEDVYQYGKVTRVSPEFPVPILRSPGLKTITVPGGSGNVGLQLKHLNCDVSLFGFVDPDMKRLLVDNNFSDYGLVNITGRNPRKIRFYDDDFPLLRWDIEEDFYGCKNLLHENRLELINRFINLLKTTPPDVVVLSNYGKGVFNQELAIKMVGECNRYKIPTIVDPKSNPSWWTGCDIFKPNISEAKTFCPGLNNPSDQAVHLKNTVQCKSVVITMAGAGVTGWNDAPFSYKPKSLVKNVESVIGAGDCFAAILAFGIGHGLNIHDACELAFEAGSQYVTAKHNQPLTWYEIYRRIDPVCAKIINVNDFLHIKDNVLHNDKLVFANGCWDLLHSGHIKSLNFAREFGDKLIVGINTDESVKKLKGPSRPMIALQQRMEMLASLEVVDFIIPFNEDTPEELIKIIKPQTIVKGEEYKNKIVVGSDIANIKFCPNYGEISTTNIISKCKNTNN